MTWVSWERPLPDWPNLCKGTHLGGSRSGFTLSYRWEWGILRPVLSPPQDSKVLPAVFPRESGCASGFIH